MRTFFWRIRQFTFCVAMVVFVAGSIFLGRAVYAVVCKSFKSNKKCSSPAAVKCRSFTPFSTKCFPVAITAISIPCRDAFKGKRCTNKFSTVSRCNTNKTAHKCFTGVKKSGRLCGGFTFPLLQRCGSGSALLTFKCATVKLSCATAGGKCPVGEGG